MIKEYKRTNRFKFFINTLIEVVKDIDSENNYNNKDFNRLSINRSINEERLCYFN